MTKKVFCIVVTYNGREWIEKCLGSLLNSTHPVKVLAVDNGSNDGTTDAIKEKFPEVQLIKTGKNAGFGQANNIGLHLAIAAQAEYIFLLNQDAWIENETISHLVEAMSADPSLGIISPVHLNRSGTKLDLYFSGYLRKAGFRELIDLQMEEQIKRPVVLDTDFVNAAAWLLSVSCVCKSGGFDPIFFHYGEDVNYCQRVLSAGFSIGIHTGSWIYHDREDRIKQTAENPSFVLKRDQINFLNQVCDIRQPAFKWVFIKRLARYSLTALIDLLLLRRSKHYNAGMATFIFHSFNAVKKSRMEAVTSTGIPFMRPG